MDDSKTLVWKRTAWNNATLLYGDLVDTCVKDTQFTRDLANLLDSAEVDSFSKTIVNLFTAANKTLPLIKDLIYSEFEGKATAEGEGSILRGNNIVNKIEGAYVRLIGANYLRHVLGDLVSKVVTDRDLCLEIDPRKLKGYLEDVEGDEGAIQPPPVVNLTPEKTKELLLEHSNNLAEISQLFIDRITDQGIIDEMPREIRAVADYTAESALKYAPESLNPLVGGFIMLRFFSPAIVTPEYSKLISSDLSVTRRAKRNLVLLTKVLQNTSNGVLFGGKEDFMTCMNGFISANKQKMTTYFHLICKDPLNPKTARWTDLEGAPSSPKSPPTSPKEQSPTIAGTSSSGGFVFGTIGGSRSSGGGSSSTNTSKGGKWTVTTPSTLAPGQTQKRSPTPPTVTISPTLASTPATPTQPALSSSSSGVQLWDSYIRNIEIQDLFDLHRILDIYRDKLACKYPNVKSVQRIVDLLRQLGPSPKTKVDKKKGAEQQQATTSALGGGFDDLTVQLERARFLFQGPNDKHDKPVFYLIVNRVKPEVFDNVNPLIAHIFKVMDSCVNLSYTLIVDMSWANIGQELKKAIITHLPKLAEVFSRKYKKNIDKLFIVHPSAYTRAVIYFMRAFTSRKLKRKIHEVYNWKQLTTYIDTENIALPETSKDYITKSYRVVKVNTKGKRQERLIKFTPLSILNIDPNSKRIQNEKRIDEIDEISSALGSLEIDMKFRQQGGSASKKLGFLTLNPQGISDSTNRKYVCNHELERDHIIQDIFETGFKMGIAKLNEITNNGKTSPLIPLSTSTTTNTSSNNFSSLLANLNEFKVVKVNNAGKHQERIFKLTIDSLMNLDQQRIKSENSFAGIEEVVIDSENPDVVWMKFKSEPNKRKIICKEGEAKQLHDVLTEVVRKYQKSIDLQEDKEQFMVFSQN